jgi:hypothetical protein
MKHVQVLALHPTQFALGMREVESKAKKLKKMTPKQRKRFLTDRLVQVVIGPNSVYYIVDHHHLVRACWEVGIKKVPVEIKANLSSMSEKNFWHAMAAAHWMHPFDQFGNGGHKPKLFPPDVRGMADDPYRSLAWAVREAGGYDKVFVPFSEFKWANYFRKKVEIEKVYADFDSAVKKALKACGDAKAAALPGYKNIS